jgi:maleylacetate reductase
MDPHAGQPVAIAGEPLGRAPVVILVHGRNAGPQNILDLVPRLARPGLTYLAPAAADRTWYPLGFMADIPQNEPKLSSALTMLAALVERVEAAGVARSRIVMIGFSQGACLASEFVARHPARYGGLIAFTGGLIGPPDTRWSETGSLEGTPVFLGSGDPDNHVPAARVRETAAVFTRMDAAVTTRIYPGMGHLVSDDEIAVAQAVVDEAARVTVLSGGGAIGRLAAELDVRGWGRVTVMTTPGRAAGLAAVNGHLGGRVTDVVDSAALHVPAARVEQALQIVNRAQPDALLAFGGGSAVGLAKAVALRTERPLPIAAVPTTYSGSEMTSIWAITDGDLKRTGRDDRVAPRIVVYDPALTLTLPPRASAASGMNAIAHAVEALYSKTASPIAAAAADQAIRLLARSLPAILAAPADAGARALALRGAHLAGVALQHASMGLHHKLCHVLGGTFGLPHADTHAALLPHVVQFNAPAAPGAMAQIASALGAADAVTGLHNLNNLLGLESRISALGLRAADIDRAADLAAASSYPNPRPVSADDVRTILKAAL